jgi:hypothetical protein
MRERIQDRIRELLAAHHVEPLDEALSRELDRVVDAARRELGADQTWQPSRGKRLPALGPRNR